jgi:hypothetical protein
MSAETDTGLLALQSGDLPGAIAQLERAVAADPGDYQAQQYLGAAYGQAGRPMDAVDALTQAVMLQPSNAQARYNLAVAYESAGYQEQALTAAQQAVQLQPDYGKARETVSRLSGIPMPPSSGIPTTSPSGYSRPPDAPQYAEPSTAPQAESTAPQYGQPAGAPYGQADAQSYEQPSSQYGQPAQSQLYAQPQPGAPYGAPSVPYQSQGAAAYGGAPMQTSVMAYGTGMENTSGMKSAVPPEIATQGWNWGAFYFSWIWSLAHGLPLIGVLILLSVLFTCWIPLLNLVVPLTWMIYLGVQGNTLAWQNRRFDGVDHFFTVQRIWAKFALGFFVAKIVLITLVVLLFVLILSHIPR